MELQWQMAPLICPLKPLVSSLNQPLGILFAAPAPSRFGQGAGDFLPQHQAEGFILRAQIWDLKGPTSRCHGGLRAQITVLKGHTVFGI